MPLPSVTAIEPQLLRSAFDDPEWVFEIKCDGFRALAYIEDGRYEFISKKGNVYKRFRDLGARIVQYLPEGDCILDGELVCLDDEGQSVFLDLMHSRGTPVVDESRKYYDTSRLKRKGR